MQGHLWPKIFYCLAKNMNTDIARLKNKGGGGASMRGPELRKKNAKERAYSTVNTAYTSSTQ